MTSAIAVTFYFDPGCPWTWRTSRWLDDVASRRDVSLRFSAFELSNGTSLDQVPELYQASAAASRLFLRAVTKADADDRNDVTAAAYTYYGTRFHDQKTAASSEMVREAWSHAGGDSYLAALDDIGLDPTVAASRARAAELAGDDVGSPILSFEVDGTTRGFFGPVVMPAPLGAAADRLWDAVLQAVALPEFFELKTRRTATP